MSTITTTGLQTVLGGLGLEEGLNEPDELGGQKEGTWYGRHVSVCFEHGQGVGNDAVVTQHGGLEFEIECRPQHEGDSNVPLAFVRDLVTLIIDTEHGVPTAVER